MKDKEISENKENIHWIGASVVEETRMSINRHSQDVRIETRTGCILHLILQTNNFKYSYVNWSLNLCDFTPLDDFV